MRTTTKAFLTLLAAHLTLAQTQPAPSPTDATDFAETTFDFVVVGGGTSGLVLASRLSENPNITVGVLEAGDYRPGDDLILIPASTGPAVLGANSQDQSNLQGNPNYDWKFKSVPQTGLNGGTILYPRGKVVGGSSAINTMIWQRASSVEYDLWESAFQNPGWSWSSLLPYFAKVENWSPPPIVLPGQEADPSLAAVHGKTGYVNVSYNNFMTDVEVPIVKSANALGIRTNSNPDAGNGTGFYYMARNVNPVTGFRSYASPAYFEPFVGRPNLKLVSEALVTKINFANSTVEGKGLVATGVDFTVGNQTFTVKANKEVILAAGSLKTPQLLELSGVGNATLLKSLGIEPLLDSPQIGENLQDHPVTYSDFQTKDGVVTLDQLTFNETFVAEAKANFSHTPAHGALSYTDAIIGPNTFQAVVNASQFNSVLALLDKELKGRKYPTELQQLQFTAARELFAEGKIAWIEVVNVPEGGVVSVPTANTSYVTTVVIQLHPFARGSVHINSTDPTAAPVINPNFLASEFDTQVLTHGLQFVRKMLNNSGIVAEYHAPDNTVQTDAQWESYVRGHVGSTAHPLGTTAMAPQHIGGVVDSHLKIYGLSNVRVVDAGIFPFTLSAAIMSSVYAVAEKAADIVKADWKI
ncbi:GMC oxidoreductase [Auriscalpium vulgare]|uniref:GMC oxidoreductase n=1 Tax=Auriscalpium vulgare TaxID=40419 RepID=A0ACB8SD86_9AGAM|nr:GMC oxidoreductase [Auriscalpium vulgare]